MPRPIKLLVAILIIAGIGWYVYGHFFAPHGGAGMQGGAPTVSVAKVIERNVEQWNEFSGRLVAVGQVDIRPRVSGTIEAVYFKNGAIVQKGDPLFTIDPRPYQAALEAANARATLAENELKRAQKLVKEKAIPQRDYDQRKNDAEVARADLVRAKLDLEYTRITSPINGRVSRAEITVGNLVDGGGNAPVLTRVVSISPIYADFEVDEANFLQYVHAETRDVSQIQVQMGLASDKDTPFKGHIESFDNRLDNTSGTIRVRAVFDNADGTLVPGLFARIRLGSSTAGKALLITDRAVGTDQSKKFVIVVGADNKTEHREVKLDGMADGLRIVHEGLKPGEQIIVSGLQRVMMPGQPVTPEVVAMDAADAPPAAAGDKKPEEKKPEEKKQP